MRAMVLVLGALLLAGCAGAPVAAPTAIPEQPTNDAAWAFTALDGQTYTSESPERNATILFFMASWCSSCRAAAPVIASVAQEYAERGVATYSLDFDPTETAEDIRAWQERYQQDWPHGIDEGLRIQRFYGVTSQSSVIVLDGEGEVVRHFGYGQASAPALRSAVEEALAA